MPAASGRLTATRIALDGQVYASPIVVGGTRDRGDRADNVVYGLDDRPAASGGRVSLGSPTDRSDLPCGNIDPLGITGTPVYDPATRPSSSSPRSAPGSAPTWSRSTLPTGKERWRRSVDLPGVDAQAMQQRGALTVLNGRVWVPFGGLAGDCGQYKGRLVGVPLSNGEPAAYTVPTTREAGIWTPPGATVFNGHLLVAVGNGESVAAATTTATRCWNWTAPAWWTRSRPATGPPTTPPTSTSARRARRWSRVNGSSSPARTATAYVLRAGRLGGIGGQVSQAELCRSFGGTAVAGDTVYVPCADGLRAVRIDGAGRLTVAWHADGSITGSPVLGGGRLYSLSPEAGVLSALDPTTGTVRERVSVGAASRFATPAISGSRLFVPTLAGLTIVDTAR